MAQNPNDEYKRAVEENSTRSIPTLTSTEPFEFIKWRSCIEDVFDTTGWTAARKKAEVSSHIQGMLRSKLHTLGKVDEMKNAADAAAALDVAEGAIVTADARRTAESEWNSAQQKRGESIEAFAVRIVNLYQVAKENGDVNTDPGNARVFMQGLSDPRAAEKVHQADWRGKDFFSLVGIAVRAQERITLRGGTKGGRVSHLQSDQEDGVAAVGRAGGGSKKGKRSRRCYVCNDEGHIARNCPSKGGNAAIEGQSQGN